MRTGVPGVRRVLAVASTRRFRAQARDRLRVSARHSMLIVILAALLNSIWLLPDRPVDLVRIAGSNILPAIGAAFAFAYFGRRRSRAPEIVIVAVLLMVDVAIATVAGIDFEIARLAGGYVLVLPPFVALLIPWSSRIHVAWLGLHIVAVVALTGLIPFASQAAGAPRILYALLTVSCAVSLLGHYVNLRARVESYLQIRQIRSMNRDMRRRDVRLVALNALLERAVVTDQLTGLGNRLALQRHLEAARHRVERYDERFSVLMFDLDRFKAINDDLGHFAGDEVLRRVAEAVDRVVRASDGTFRFGGEEFLAVVRLDPGDDPMSVAERIRLAVEGLAMEHPANPPHGVVTVSVGATVVDRMNIGGSADTWLRAADAAMYEAKRSGRNCSVIG